MSTSPLGTLLATRLDAVLGTTLAQHPVLLEGMKPHNVTQPASAMHPQDSVIQRGGAPLGEAGARQGRPGAVARGNAGAAGLPGAKGQELPGGIQPSARAILSEPAKTILALLLSRPGNERALQGQMPLWLAAGRASLPAGAAGGGSAPAPTTAGQAGTAAGPGGSAPAVIDAGPKAAGTQAMLPKAPEGMVQTLTRSLGQTVGNSGLFYESHLSQMVFGKRSASQLLQEPQAMLGRIGNAAETAGGAPAAAASTAGQHGNSPSAGLASQAAGTFQQGMSAEPGGQSSPAGGNTLQGTPAPVPGVHPDAVGVVRQQLEALANSTFNWQGEAWPGAGMQWEISEDAKPHDSGEPASWATRLVLQLPALGEVQARISLAGDALVLRLLAPDSAPLLQEFAPVLRQNLQASGLILTDLAVMAQAPQAGTPNADLASAALSGAPTETTGNSAASGMATSPPEDGNGAPA